eukprot:6065881-Prymnesium_polylepis.1
MGVRASPPVRSRERCRDVEEKRDDVSPVRGLWTGGMAGGGDGLTADEQALSAGPEAAGRVRASERRERREEESPAL